MPPRHRGLIVHSETRGPDPPAAGEPRTRARSSSAAGRRAPRRPLAVVRAERHLCAALRLLRGRADHPRFARHQGSAPTPTSRSSTRRSLACPSTRPSSSARPSSAHSRIATAASHSCCWGRSSAASPSRCSASASPSRCSCWCAILEGFSTASSAPATLGYISAQTAGSDRLRGRVMGFYEAATVVGLAAGAAVGGLLYQVFGTLAFTLIALVYGLSFLLFMFVRRHGRLAPDDEPPRHRAAAAQPTHPALRSSLAGGERRARRVAQRRPVTWLRRRPSPASS